MSNITIYHPLLAQDTELRLKTEEILGIIQQGNALRLQLAMKLAEQYELISAKSRRAHKGELQEIMCELYGIKRSTYFKHVKAGKIYLAEPDKRHLSLSAVLAKPTDLQTSPAVDAELDALVGQAKARSTYAHTINDESQARSTYAHTINDEAQAKASLLDAHKLTKERETELLKWEAFAHWLSAQMPADQFDKVYNRFCAQYRA